MAVLNDTNLDTHIERKLRALGAIVRDEWHDAESAANHLKISKAHFLRVANAGNGPGSSGHGRMRRWRTSALDAWQTGKEQNND